MKNQQAETAYKKLTDLERELARTVDIIFSQFDEDISGSFSLKEFQRFIRTVPQSIKYFSSQKKSLDLSDKSDFISEKLNQLYKLVKIVGRQKYLQEFEEKIITNQQMEKEYSSAKDNDKQIDKLEMYCFFKYALSDSIIGEAITASFTHDGLSILNKFIPKKPSQDSFLEGLEEQFHDP